MQEWNANHEQNIILSYKFNSEMWWFAVEINEQNGFSRYLCSIRSTAESGANLAHVGNSPRKKEEIDEWIAYF